MMIYSVLSIPFGKLSAMHIALNKAVLSPNTLPLHVSRPPLVNWETKYWISCKISTCQPMSISQDLCLYFWIYVLLNMATYVC